MQPSAYGPNSFSDLTKRTAEAVYIAVRYDMADENGETRRQRNARFGLAESPELEVPDAAVHVWVWFWQLSGRRYIRPEALTFADIGQRASLLQIEPLAKVLHDAMGGFERLARLHLPGDLQEVRGLQVGSTQFPDVGEHIIGEPLLDLLAVLRHPRAGGQQLPGDRLEA